MSRHTAKSDYFSQPAPGTVSAGAGGEKWLRVLGYVVGRQLLRGNAMMIRRIPFFPSLVGLILLFSVPMAVRAVPVAESGQPGTETIGAGSSIARQVKGGDANNFQIHLTPGQFLRVVVEQQAIDVVLVLTAPEGKQVSEVNLTGAGGMESLAEEVGARGAYRLTIRALGSATLSGAYLVRVEIKDSAVASDQQRITAGHLLIEADALLKRGPALAQQTIEKLQQALAQWRELGEQYWEAYTLNHLGRAYRLLSRYEQAVEYHEQALALRRAVKDQAGEGITLDDLGSAYNFMSRAEKAIEYHEQALRIGRQVKNRAGEAVTLLRLGNASLTLSRYEKAIEYYEQALAIYREVQNRNSEADALNNLGNAHRLLSRYEQAIGYYEQALAIYRELKDRTGEGNACNNLGNAYRLLSRYEKSIEYYEQALAIYREVKFRNGEGGVLNNLGTAYNSLGRYEKTIDYYEQALVIFRAVKDRNGEGGALNNLGSAHRSLGQSEQAIAYHHQALAIYREVKNRDNEGSALTSLGNAYRSLGRYEQAIEYHEQALAIARAVKARGRESDPLIGLGEDYRLQGQYEKATQFHAQALTVARQIKQRDNEARALNHLMLDWRARKQPPLAVFYGKQSVNLYQEIRNDIRSLDRVSQQSFVKSKEETYRTLADLLIAQGRLPEAEQVIKMIKQEEYFDFIRRDLSNSPKTEKARLTREEEALDTRYHEIADHIAELGTERGELLDKKSRTPTEEQRLVKLDADLTVAGQVFQKFLDGLANELGKNAEASNRVFQLRESQGMMEALRDLGKRTVALYTLVGEDKYRVILTTADVQKGFEYPIKAADLNRKILAFRDVLQNPKLDPLPLAQELYQILVAPLAKDLRAVKAETLMWSLDGVLRYLPIAALHDGDKYLVERWRNVVFTPASQTRLKDEVSRNWKVLGLGVTKAHGLTIPALPGVAEELRGIIKAEGASSGVLPGTIKLDEQFTQEAMLTGLRGRPLVVHIASHFQFKPGNETASALLLGDGQFLSLAQIKSLPNVFSGVELLTLSACNTATGGSGATGKEVEGFGVLAQRQGAKAVIASLWPVADRSTKNLMQEFYQLREAKAGVTKAEALRQAQIKLLRGALQVTGEMLAARSIIHEEDKTTNKPLFKIDAKKPYAHPYYWAPFILIGNWK